MVCLATDGRGTVATGGDDSRTRLWDVTKLVGSGPSPRPLAVVESLSGGLISVALSDDLVATGHSDGKVKLWRRNGELIGNLGTFRDQPINALRFDRSGRMLAVGHLGPRGVELWDLAGGDLARAVDEGRRRVRPGGRDASRHRERWNDPGRPRGG